MRLDAIQEQHESQQAAAAQRVVGNASLYVSADCYAQAHHSGNLHSAYLCMWAGRARALPMPRAFWA